MDDPRRDRLRHTLKPIGRFFDLKFFLLLVLAGLFVTVWYANRKEEAVISESILPPVRLARAEQGPLTKTLRLSGHARCRSRVTVLPKISGTLLELRVAAGDELQSGDIIGIIDPGPYELQLKQAEAAYRAHESTYQRISKLFNTGATSRQNYDEALAAYNASKARYDLAKLQYGYTAIEAPISGVVLQTHSDPGAMAAPQVPLVTIGEIDELQVTVPIPEKYYTLFRKKGDTMPVHMEIPHQNDHQITATVTNVAPYVSPATRNFEVICSLTGNTESLRPGMFIYITFVLDKRDPVYSLPFSALVSGETLWYWEPAEETARALDFTPGFQTRERFAIPDEWAGYRFIVEGQHFLREGQRVRVLNPGAAP